MVDSRILENYRELGYCRLERVLASALLQTIAQQMDALFSLQVERLGERPVPHSGQKSLLANMRTCLETDAGVYLASARHAAKLVSLQRLTACDEVESLVRGFGIDLQTIPTAPVLHIMSDELRIPDGYFGVGPHQDWPSIQGGLDTVTMWVPLMDVSRDCFPLEFIPRSHMRGLWEGDVRENALEIRESLYQKGDWVPVPANCGDVVVFSGFTVHRTRLEDCHGLRIASSTRYENAHEPTFVARGYPCAYKRTVQRDFINPNFPSVDQVRALFGAGVEA